MRKLLGTANALTMMCCILLVISLLCVHLIHLFRFFSTIFVQLWIKCCFYCVKGLFLLSFERFTFKWANPLIFLTAEFHGEMIKTSSVDAAMILGSCVFLIARILVFI